MPALAPPVVQDRLLRILHRAFVQARNLAQRGDCEQLYDLADTFEILPELMARWDETTLGQIRGILADFQAAHPECGYEYVSLLDAEDGACQANGFNVVPDTGNGARGAE
jgi:hypothetical protein